MFPMRGRRYVTLAFLLVLLIFMLVITDNRNGGNGYLKQYLSHPEENHGPPDLKYIPKPDWQPPPVRDPFPLLSTSSSSSSLPPVPWWNKPEKDLHLKYGLDYAPPLFIGFTRTWPVLLQAVVSYITAGWPPESIYVVENTGVQRANLDGQLSVQNPFFLDHAQLAKLGVQVVRTPVLMNFAQLQNFYVHLSYEMSAPHYFWSHQDVLVLSYEDGQEKVTPRATEPGYKTVYQLCLAELQRVKASDERWADKFFAYDHLTLVNRVAYEDVGGWDTFIPYYMTDCDMHSRLMMRNWTQLDVKAGIITDVGAVLDNLLALYRDPSVEVKFTDPNPPPPPPSEGGPKAKRDVADEPPHAAQPRADEVTTPAREPREEIDAGMEYWRKLQRTADEMFHYKHGDRGRNTWQLGQQGGQGEPFYYPSRGIAEGVDIMTEAGREVFRRKWGHRDCNLIGGTKMRAEDQWLVEPDWT